MVSKKHLTVPQKEGQLQRLCMPSVGHGDSAAQAPGVTCGASRAEARRVALMRRLAVVAVLHGLPVSSEQVPTREKTPGKCLVAPRALWWGSNGK